MTVLTADRIDGVNSGVSIKAPVKAATTANITLSGLQTIDGVALAADDRVLVMDQTTASENGIYVASSTSWERAKDFDGNRDVKEGTLVTVTDGSVNGGLYFRVTTSDPITIDTSSINFEQALTADGASISFVPEYSTVYIAKSIRDKARQRIDASDYAADDGTDITATLQAMLDYYSTSTRKVTLMLPSPTVAWGIDQLIVKQNGLRLEGDAGGKVKLKYVGTAAAAHPIIRADKSTDHGAQNYTDCIIENFTLDGDGKALYGVLLNGWTRRCRLETVEITGCVCPVKVTDGFYSSMRNIEFLTTPASCPSGMDPATYAANLYLLLGNTCHIMSIENPIVFDCGGNASNQYTAGFDLTSSEGVLIKSLQLQDMQRTAHTRYIARMFNLSSSTTTHFDSGHWEDCEAGDQFIRVNDLAQFSMNNIYMNGIIAPVLLQGQENSPITLDSVFGERMDITDRLFKLTSGDAFRSLRRKNSSFMAGELTGGVYDANTNATAKYGFASDPIRIDNGGDTIGNGYVKRGYTPSIVGDSIEVTGGEAVINGQPVEMGRYAGTVQKLWPDLTHTGTWDLMISCAGNVYAQKQSAPLAGDVDALKIGEFATAAGAVTPASLVTSNFAAASTRLPGEVRRALPGAAKINKTLIGSVPLTSGAAVTLATATFAHVDNKQDFVRFDVTIDYYDPDTAGSGAEFTPHTAKFRAVCSQDKDKNRIEDVEAASEIGDLDAGLGSMSIASGHAWTGTNSEIFNLQVTATNGDGRAMVGFVKVEAIGGLQTETTVAIGGAVSLAV